MAKTQGECVALLSLHVFLSDAHEKTAGIMHSFFFKQNTRSLATFGIKSPPIRPGTASTRQGRCHRRPSAELVSNEPGFLREVPIASGHRIAIYVYPPNWSWQSRSDPATIKRPAGT